mgnify:CR=1 FL=1
MKLVFSNAVKRKKMKTNAKFRVSRHFHFAGTKRIMSPNMHPKRFGTFEKPEHKLRMT